MATKTIDPREEKQLGRRGFLASAAGGLTLSFFLPEFSRLGQAEAANGQVNTWLTIDGTGTVTLTIGASEMGQGSFSGLAQVLSEDLMVDYKKVKTVQAPPIVVAPPPGTPLPIGYAIPTVGSGMIRNNYWRMRNAAAAAREMLVQACMNAVGDPTRGSYSVSNGVVTYTGPKVVVKKVYNYGELANAAALLTPPANPPLVPDNLFTTIGKTLPRLDIPNKVDGSAIYGIDVRIPGMKYAVVKHCPTFGGTLPANWMAPQGKQIVPLKVWATTNRGTEAVGNYNAIAAVGPTTWDAWQTVNGVNVPWVIPSTSASISDAGFLAQAQALTGAGATPFVAGGANPPGTLYTVEGDANAVKTAVNGAPITVDATYSLPYVAHACMEVLNCTVNITFDTQGTPVACEIWAPTQGSKSVMSIANLITGVAPANITVHTTYLGGGLGRKYETDFVSQAIQVAMAIKAPVKLMWPREQDFTRDQYRPAALIHAHAGLDAHGNVLGWSYRNISPSILGQRGAVLGAKGDSQGIEGAQALPYNFGTRVTEYVTHPSPVPVGFWRSVGASLNTFGVECMIDEMAVAAKMDPYLYRRNLLTDARWIAVLDAAAKLGNWLQAPPAGHARGIAIGTAFNSIVAEVVEISNVTSTSLRVNHVAVAIDCYLQVNPGQIQAQLQGGVVHGLNAALYGHQSFVAGAAQAKNFSHSRMIKIGEMPQVDITIIPAPSTTNPTTIIGGVGELGVPTFAPALANAYAKLTGKRVRTLPFFPNATMSD